MFKLFVVLLMVWLDPSYTIDIHSYQSLILLIKNAVIGKHVEAGLDVLDLYL